MPSVRGGIFGTNQAPAGAPIGDEVLVEAIVLVVVVVVEGSRGDTRGRIKVLEPRVATDAVFVIVVIVGCIRVVGRAFSVSIVIIPVHGEVKATNLVVGNDLSTAEATKEESCCKVLQNNINPMSFVEQFDFFRLVASFDRVDSNRVG